MKKMTFQQLITSFLLVLVLAGCSLRSATPVQMGQHAYTFEREGRSLNYLLFVPQDYRKESKWPLILFLHGIGERGDGIEDLELVKKYGPPMLVEEQGDFPFMVLSPQCPADSSWDNHLDDLEALLDEIVSNYAVDTDRIYVTGLSMGGFGTMQLALQNPDRYAALVPIAGGFEYGRFVVPDNVCVLKDVPLWVFHGALDDLVLPLQSEQMVEAIQECGGDVKFTLYPDADHYSWDETYANPDLYKWLLQQNR